MMDNNQELLRKLERLKRRAAEAGGELKGVLSALKKHGFESVKAAAAWLPGAEDEVRRLAKEVTAAKQKLEEDYKDELEES